MLGDDNNKEKNKYLDKQEKGTKKYDYSSD